VRRALDVARSDRPARDIYREIGQVPVTINREINGFVLNRLQGALLAEAFRLVGEGYISTEDLDHTVKDGPAYAGRSWSIRDHRTQRARRHPDYCARYTGFYKETGVGGRRTQRVRKSERRPGDRGIA